MASVSPRTWFERPGRFSPPPGHDVVRPNHRGELLQAERRRPRGRIGGMAWCDPSPSAVTALEAALGADAELLLVDRHGQGRVQRAGDALAPSDLRGPAHRALVGDWDACFVGDDPVPTREAWSKVVRADRLGRVEGAFAVAWVADGVLRLARDAPGERTLYYAPVGRGLVFASSVRALLATGLVGNAAIDPDALAAYLSFAYVPGHRSLVEGIFEVLPGEVIEVEPNRLSRRTHWAAAGDQEQPAVTGGHEDSQRDLLLARLERAVARRLPAGEPVGATLSGGIDSSAVVALARRLHDAPVFTYAASFGPRYPNELEFSSLVATHCDTPHRILEISPRLVLRHLDEAISLLSKPIGDPLTVPNALLFREASLEVGVVLNGEGGDPCFGGPKNLPMVLAVLYQAAASEDEGLWLERTYLHAHQKAYCDLHQALVPELAATLAARTLERSVTLHLTDPRWATLVNRLMATNVALKGAHHILVKVDQISERFGVLPRSPLFDRSVVELALGLPARLKLHGSVEKHVLKQAMVGLLPPIIIDRPKSGMRVPVEQWFQGPLRAHARERLLDGLAGHGLIRRAYLEDLLSTKGDRYRPRRGVKIWMLLALEAWLRTVYVPRARPISS